LGGVASPTNAPPSLLIASADNWVVLGRKPRPPGLPPTQRIAWGVVTPEQSKKLPLESTAKALLLVLAVTHWDGRLSSMPPPDQAEGAGMAGVAERRIGNEYDFRPKKVLCCRAANILIDEANLPRGRQVSSNGKHSLWGHVSHIPSVRGYENSRVPKDGA
jgi:hypothetical protein